MQSLLLIVRELTKLLYRIGIPESQGRILSALLLLGPLTQDYLASLLGYSISTMSENLTALEAKGLVKRVGKIGRKNLYATTKGFSVLVQEHLERFLNDLGELIKRIEMNEQYSRLKMELEHVKQAVRRVLSELDQE